MWSLGNIINLDFYPRPPRGGRHHCSYIHDEVRKISIHALREEGDFRSRVFHRFCPISIHALREEGDQGAGASKAAAT